ITAGLSNIVRRKSVLKQKSYPSTDIAIPSFFIEGVLEPLLRRAQNSSSIVRLTIYHKTYIHSTKKLCFICELFSGYNNNKKS
ncbi:hypothetical protein, partial [Anoxybacillus flavithermus]|uniref:hypothetical protein n=1 Tax=Anoxybacillus flavithermus TaxID=33934 RepID=UPI001E3501E3